MSDISTINNKNTIVQTGGHTSSIAGQISEIGTTNKSAQAPKAENKKSKFSRGFAKLRGLDGVGGETEVSNNTLI